MNHVQTKTSGKRWWWWVALVCAIVVVVSIPISFFWTVSWNDLIEQEGISLVNGSIVYIDFNNSSQDQGQKIQAVTPWHDKFSIIKSGTKIHWRFLPNYVRINKTYWFQIPTHTFLVVLIPIIFYPLLPFVKKRQRRKQGLCIKCAYDLTGNESGTCPECGTEIQP